MGGRDLEREMQFSGCTAHDSIDFTSSLSLTSTTGTMLHRSHVIANVLEILLSVHCHGTVVVVVIISIIVVVPSATASAARS